MIDVRRMRTEERKVFRAKIEKVMRDEPHRVARFFEERFQCSRTHLNKIRAELGLGPWPRTEHVTAKEARRAGGNDGKRASQQWAFKGYKAGR